MSRVARPRDCTLIDRTGSDEIIKTVYPKILVMKLMYVKEWNSNMGFYRPWRRPVIENTPVQSEKSLITALFGKSDASLDRCVQE